MILQPKVLLFLVFLTLIIAVSPAAAQEWHGEQRVMRYHPEGGDFVINNGTRRFNRALYGTNTAFRVEAGDLPEFAMYMPGMGGNLKFALQKGEKSIWLIAAKDITARYTPGKMSYVIKDPLLGSGSLHLVVLALADAEGMVVKASYEGAETDITLMYVFGGASGKKFFRSGDMGPDPESSFYLHPDYCKTNVYRIKQGAFNLTYGAKQDQTLTGFFPANLKLADATKLDQVEAFDQSTESATPVVTAKKKLLSDESQYIVIKNPASNPAPLQLSQAASLFNAAETARKKIAGQISINTPDPYLNTLGAAISIASDAIWEDPSYLHGAVGWRMRLNGWRGAYTADPLGWHDRAKTHFRAYAKSQLLGPTSGPVVADTAFHLARHQEKMGTSMFTEGYISRDPEGKSLRPHHYDMNLVFIDALLWHLNWTGDLDFAREMWPVLQRHLDWEKRNFDPNNNGLYDAYAAIWASDALYYSGGEVTHSTAYNYRANLMASKIAALIGEDAGHHDQEAKKILTAINNTLWMPERGVYAEYQDGMGLKALHPAAALWTIYHSLDSDIANPFQAFQSLKYIDNEIPHLPILAKGMPGGKYHTLSTTNWMPYVWSINNVTMAESMHTALANWQAGRHEQAFNLFKSEILASMYLGGSPGNFVQISHYDAIRGEAYRDFADPVGVSSRALVNGLFGIIPDALHKKLVIRPGFPAAWDYASIRMADLDFSFKRSNSTDRYTFKQNFARPLSLVLQLKARGTSIAQVLVNGKKTSWTIIDSAVGEAMVEIVAAPAPQYSVEIKWQGETFKGPAVDITYATGDQLVLDYAGATILALNDPQETFATTSFKAGLFKAQLGQQSGHRTAFLQLKKGDYTWWQALSFKVEPTLSLQPAAKQTKNQLLFTLVNNSTKPIKGILSGTGFKKEIDLKAKEQTELNITGKSVSAGRNAFIFIGANKERIVLELTNWNVDNPVPAQRTVDLSSFFNDQVTQIFKNKYLSPRPTAGPTLQIPWQGLGDWPHALAIADIDDSGLRQLAGKNNQVTLPQGISFSTPGEAQKNNILFTSQWDNYPTEKVVPLNGSASHAYFLMAGSTNHMQSQFDNGQVVITYTDGTTAVLTLRNPETWWPIQEDYYVDGFAFRLKTPAAVRVHLKTGKMVSGAQPNAKVGQQVIPGGAATVLDLPLDPAKTLKSLTLKTLANDVVIGLMGVTLTK
jgi:hypothetical protein